jgi:hypothetical protein
VNKLGTQTPFYCGDFFAAIFFGSTNWAGLSACGKIAAVAQYQKMQQGINKGTIVSQYLPTATTFSVQDSAVIDGLRNA